MNVPAAVPSPPGPPGPPPRPLKARLIGLVLRPTAPPPVVGIAVAAAFITVETLTVHHLQKFGPGNAFGAVFLLGVLVVSAGWDMWLALATSLVSATVYVYFHMDTHGVLMPAEHNDIVAIAIFLPLALLTNVLVGQARLRAADARRAEREIAASHATVSALAGQQTALRRVATLVARGRPPDEVYPAAVDELASGLGMDHVALLRYADDGAPEVVASRDPAGTSKLRVGERLNLDGPSVVAMVAESAAPARIDSYDEIDGGTAQLIRSVGIRCGVGAPVVVGGEVRAVLVVGSAQPHSLPADTEARLGDFADLVATAIGNAETHAELMLSRTRIVAAGDQARRRFERDLHDGAQQRVVSLSLALRAVEAAIPDEHNGLRTDVAKIVDGMSALSTELQELSRGIHPAILSRGGLAPALRALARRSPVPVELELDIPEPVPETVGVAAYYVVAEALTNSAKYAEATFVAVVARCEDGTLHLSIGDDGVGGATAGADARSGSGLTGLKDRVAALSGSLDISSPPGHGTTLVARIPLDCG